MLPTLFTEKASKTIVSRDASDNFHRKSFQNDRFVRGFSKFHKKKFQNQRFVRGFLKFSQCFQNLIVDNPRPMRRAIPTAQNLHFATVSCNRPTESYEMVHPAKSKCASRYNGVPSKISKGAFRYSGVHKNVYMNQTHDVRGNPRHTKITILPQFRTSDQHEVTRGLRGRSQNLRFNTVLDIRSARNDERVARATSKFAFHHSFGRPISTKRCERVARRHKEFCISPQFWASDEHEVTRGLRPRRDKFEFHHSFGRPMSMK